MLLLVTVEVAFPSLDDAGSTAVLGGTAGAAGAAGATGVADMTGAVGVAAARAGAVIVGNSVGAAAMGPVVDWLANLRAAAVEAAAWSAWIHENL